MEGTLGETEEVEEDVEEEEEECDDDDDDDDDVCCMSDGEFCSVCSSLNVCTSSAVKKARRE